MSKKAQQQKGGIDLNRIITPVAILSFPHVFEPWKGPDGQQAPKFGATFIFPQGTDLSGLKAAVLQAAREKFGPEADQQIRAGKLRMPFRTDVEEKGYPAGSTFIGARRDPMYGPVGVYSRVKGDDGKPREITREEQVLGNPNEIYAGAKVRGLLTCFGYDRNGNRGVSFGLVAVQKVEDGERLDNRASGRDLFEADLSEEPASLEQIGGQDNLDDLM